MSTETPGAGIYPYGIRPWDISEPGFTHSTRRLGTFLLFLMEEDTEGVFVDFLSPVYAVVRLLGPNGNELTYRIQRMSTAERTAISAQDSKTVVETLRSHPMMVPEGQKAIIAATLGVYLGLDKKGA